MTPGSLPFRAYYFLIFAGPAIVGTYLNLYFRRIGLSDSQIGLLSGLMAILSILSPPAWGAAADRLRSRRVPDMLLLLATGLLFPLFWWVHRFAALLAVVALFGFFMSPIVPLADAGTITHLKRHGGDYGRIRVWGSVGYALVLGILGLLLPSTAHSPASALAPVFLVFPLCRLAAIGLAAIMPEEATGGVPASASLWRAMLEAATLFRGERLRLVSLCAFLGWGAMQAYYAFFPIFLDTLRVPDSQKGLYINIGVAAEILFLSQAGKLQKRLGPYGLLTLGLAAQATRLFLFSYRVPLWALGLGQAIHAFTFGAFYVACIAILTVEAPDHLRAGGQAFFSGLVMGLGAALGAWLSGQLAHAFGLETMFRVASGIAAAACLLSLRLLHERAADA